MKRIPFPQANDIEKIYSIFYDIGSEGLSKFDVSKKYLIDEREGQYYLDALLFIGLVEKINVKYFLNYKGNNLRTLKGVDMKKEFANKVLENEFLYHVYSYWIEIKDSKERKEYIASCIYNGDFGLGHNTSIRRASCINTWFDWIYDKKQI